MPATAVRLGSTSPVRTPQAAAAMREDRPSMRRILARCRWTVCSLSTSRRAISALLKPYATSFSTSSFSACPAPVGPTSVIRMVRTAIPASRAVIALQRARSGMSVIGRTLAMSSRVVTRPNRRACLRGREGGSS